MPLDEAVAKYRRAKDELKGKAQAYGRGAAEMYELQDKSQALDAAVRDVAVAAVMLIPTKRGKHGHVAVLNMIDRQFGLPSSGKGER